MCYNNLKEVFLMKIIKINFVFQCLIICFYMEIDSQTVLAFFYFGKTDIGTLDSMVIFIQIRYNTLII